MMTRKRLKRTCRQKEPARRRQGEQQSEQGIVWYTDMVRLAARLSQRATPRRATPPNLELANAGQRHSD